MTQQQMRINKDNDSPRILTIIWVVLMALTLFSALIAERVEPTTFVIGIVCLTVAIKGGLVIEQLMGLHRAVPGIRWVMLSYFFILPPIVAWAILFPELVVRLTSL